MRMAFRMAEIMATQIFSFALRVYLRFDAILRTGIPFRQIR
jgi:hypothetical protein